MADLVVVCLPVAGPAIAPCGVVNGVPMAPGVVERPAVTPEHIAALSAWSGPVDWGQAAQFLAFSLSTVVGVWFAAWAVGVVVDLVKRA